MRLIKLHIMLALAVIYTMACAKDKTMTTNPKYNPLTPGEEAVIVHKATEPPFSGKYHAFFEEGTYICKRCNTPLYRSSDKFNSHCGWPSFDDEIPGAVKKIPDADGQRTEIICASCSGHLGHVFVGEGFTEKNTRHCVNSLSLVFVPKSQEVKADRAIFAAGCFWGVQYYLERVRGVIRTTVGYTGGHVENPSYRDVCTGTTGHAEAVEVVFDPAQTSFEQLTKLFFETHDFTQVNGQGPDIGEQYRSAIFILDENQEKIAEKLIAILEKKGYKVATQVRKAGAFWKAEEYHQQYYVNRGGTPYCHRPRKVFD